MEDHIIYVTKMKTIFLEDNSYINYLTKVYDPKVKKYLTKTKATRI